MRKMVRLALLVDFHDQGPIVRWCQWNASICVVRDKISREVVPTGVHAYRCIEIFPSNGMMQPHGPIGQEEGLSS